MARGFDTLKDMWIDTCHVFISVVFKYSNSVLSFLFQKKIALNYRFLWV